MQNVYLFEINIPPLQTQKHNRELEIIVQECILNTVRDSIPVEAILQAYMDETIEEHVVEEIKEQEIEDPNNSIKSNEKTQIISETSNSNTEINKDPETPKQLESDTISSILEQNKLEAQLAFPSLTNEDEPNVSSSSKLSFSDVDYAADLNNNVQAVDAPKTFERLEEISSARNTQRRMEESDDDDDENVRLQIYDQNVELDNLDVHNIEFPELKLEPDMLLNDIEVLE
jgi:hypothetical protein